MLTLMGLSCLWHRGHTGCASPGARSSVPVTQRRAGLGSWVCAEKAHYRPVSVHPSFILRLERQAGTQPALVQAGLWGDWCLRGLLLWEAGARGLVGVTQHFRQRAMAHCTAVQGRCRLGET